MEENRPSRTWGESADAVAFLMGSPVRPRILETLADGPVERHRLKDRIDAPRATVHQNLRKLEQRGWVDRDGETYRCTWRGKTLISEYERCLSTLDTAERLQPVLEHVDVAAVDLEVFGDATVVTPSPNRPMAPIDRVVDLVDSADAVDGVTPYLVPPVVESVHSRVTAGALDHDVVVAPAAAEQLRQDHPETFRDSTVAGAVYREAADSIPFLLFVLSGTVLLGAFDEDGLPRAVAETDDPDAVAWASDVVAQYQSAAAIVVQADN